MKTIKITNIAEKFINLIFPVKCVICGKISHEPEGIICVNCRGILIKEASVDCRKCKNPPDSCVCVRTNNLDRVIFPYFYRGDNIRMAIYKLKRNNLKYINEFFAKSMYNSLKISDKINIGDIDFITGAPRKQQAVKFYGYNQTEILAKIIAEYAGVAYLPILKASGLYKTEQKSIISYDQSKRLSNVENKFIPVKNFRYMKEKIEDKNILITDDVITTGSTLSECARVMKNMGAKSVSALCIAAVNNR